MTVADIRLVPPLLTLISTYIEHEANAEDFRQWCGSAFSERAEIVALNDEAAKPSSSWRMLERLAARCTVCFDRLPSMKLPPLVHRLIRADFWERDEQPDSHIVSVDATALPFPPSDFVSRLPAVRRLRYAPDQPSADGPSDIRELLTKLGKLEVLDLRSIARENMTPWMANLTVGEAMIPTLKKLSLGDEKGYIAGDYSPFVALPHLEALHLASPPVLAAQLLASVKTLETNWPDLEVIYLEAHTVQKPAIEDPNNDEPLAFTIKREVQEGMYRILQDLIEELPKIRKNLHIEVVPTSSGK